VSATVPPPDHTASRLTDDDLDVIVALAVLDWISEKDRRR
jgi:hypothetical protein